MGNCSYPMFFLACCGQYVAISPRFPTWTIDRARREPCHDLNSSCPAPVQSLVPFAPEYREIPCSREFPPGAPTDPARSYAQTARQAMVARRPPDPNKITSGNSGAVQTLLRDLYGYVTCFSGIGFELQMAGAGRVPVGIACLVTSVRGRPAGRSLRCGQPQLFESAAPVGTAAAGVRAFCVGA